VNIDIGAHSFAPLRAKDSNPGKVELSLGGVGRNIAHNMRLLGVPTYLLTAVGGDSRASQVEESCKELGIDLSHALRVPDGRTSTYVFVGDSDGDMAVAVADMEICEKLTPDYFASQKELLDGAAAVVVDANLPRESIAYLVEHCAAPLFVDPVSTVKAEKLQGLLSHVHTLKPNRIEAELLSGVKISDDATLHQAAQALLDQGVQRVFLSLGGDGVFAAQQGETHLEPICKAEMRNATGAGDAMMASLVWSFLAGRNLAESCAAGTAAAAIAVESEETINPNMSAEAVLARAKIDSDATDDEVIAQAEAELRKLAMPIKETCMTVFDVLDLRLVGDERGGDVGIVDRAADRRVRDLAANAAAGLEAVRKAAAPQVRLVEVDAAAVLHDVAADGGDVSDLRGHRQRRRPRGRRWSAARSSAPFHPPSEAERAGCPSS